MSHGGEQLDETSSPFKIVDRSENGGEIEREIEFFRRGEYSRFKASSRVANELEKWVGVSDKEREKAFDLYLAEINSFAVVTSPIYRTCSIE